MNLSKKLVLLISTSSALAVAVAPAPRTPPAHRHAGPQQPNQLLAQQTPPPPMNFGPGGPGGVQGLPPGVTQEQFDAALAEVDTFFKNMSDEEMNDFLNFVQDIESGKIDINELLPPEMLQQMPPPPGKPQPTVKPTTPVEEKTPTPSIPEKPKAPALRSKSAAQQMLKNILDKLMAIRSKAATYERVNDALKPWNKKLDDLTYYAHVISDKDHIDQLISDKDLLPVHDALKEFSDALTVQEPLLHVPEFGVEELEPAIKERSKRALKNILTSFDTLFSRRSILTGLEQLMKKYEPELLKKRKEAESAQERAAKDAETRRSQQPTPSHIRSQEYGRGRGFYDQYYSPRSGGGSRAEYTPSRYQPTRDRDEGRPMSGGAQPKPLEAAGEKKDGKKVDTKSDKKPQEPKETTPGAAREEKKKEYVPSTEHEKNAVKHMEDLGNIFGIITNTIESEEFLLDPGLYFSQDAQPGTEQQQFETLEKAKAMNESFKTLSDALHRIARKVSLAQSSIKKSPRKAQGHLNKKLSKTLKDNAFTLYDIYDAGLELLRTSTIVPTENPTADQKKLAEQRNKFKNKFVMHLGYEIAPGIPEAYTQARSKNLMDYLEAYEMVYKPTESEDRKKIKADLDKEIEEKERKAGAVVAPAAPESESDEEADDAAEGVGE